MIKIVLKGQGIILVMVYDPQVWFYYTAIKKTGVWLVCDTNGLKSLDLIRRLHSEVARFQVREFIEITEIFQ